MSSTVRADLSREKFFLSLVDNGLLRITKSGRAYNTKTKNELGKASGRNKYRDVAWHVPGTPRGQAVHIRLHRLVWAVYQGIPTDPTLEVNHKDGNKDNCALRNLELGSHQSNVRHAFSTGLSVGKAGEDHNLARFSNEEVRKFRKQYEDGTLDPDVLVSTHQVSRVSVIRMLERVTYSSVK